VNPVTFGSMERDGIVLSVDSRGLTLRTLEYHCPPAHLDREELRRLVGAVELREVGLRLRRTPFRCGRKM